MRNYLKWTSALAVLAGLVVATPAQAEPTCAPARVTVDSTDAYEGAAQLFRITATAEAGCAATGLVRYGTEAGSAAPGSDFTAVAGTLEWQPGTPASVTVAVPVSGDSTPEADETFSLRLLDPRGLEIGSGPGTGTIIDDDGKERPPLVMAIHGGGICWQPNDVCQIPLKLSTVALAPLSVRWSTQDIEAIAGLDYVRVKAATVYFETGSDTAYAVVDLLPSHNPEPVRFLALLGNPTAGSVSDGKVAVTIGWQ